MVIEPLYKKFVDALIEAEKERQRAEHLINVIYPVVKDTKIFLRALERLHKYLVLTISNILKYEYLYKRIELSKDAKKNLEVFFKRCSGKYGLNELDNQVVREILALGKKHKDSGFEFSKAGKVVILNDDLGINELSLDKLKEYIALLKRLSANARSNFGQI